MLVRLNVSKSQGQFQILHSPLRSFGYVVKSDTYQDCPGSPSIWTKYFHIRISCRYSTFKWSHYPHMNSLMKSKTRILFESCSIKRPSYMCMTSPTVCYILGHFWVAHSIGHTRTWQHADTSQTILLILALFHNRIVAYELICPVLFLHLFLTRISRIAFFIETAGEAAQVWKYNCLEKYTIGVFLQVISISKDYCSS